MGVASVVLVGGSTASDMAVTVGSIVVLAGTDDDPGRIFWREGGFGCCVGDRSRELEACALMGCGCGCGSVTLDIAGDALAANTGRGGVGSVGSLFGKLGVEGAEIVIERTGS